VVHEYGPEVEGWRDIVVPRVLAVVRQPLVALLEPLDAEISRAHVHSRSVGSLTHFEPKSMHGECVRARGRFEIHVEAAGELGHRLTVDEPRSGSVALEAEVVLSERRPTDDERRAGGPAGVEREGVADRPRLLLLDRRGVPLEEVAVGLATEKENFEARSSVEMAPGGSGRQIDVLAPSPDGDVRLLLSRRLPPEPLPQAVQPLGED